MRLFSFFLKLIILSVVVTAVSAQEAKPSITILGVSSIEDERIYYMDAVIEIQLPDYIAEAVYSGVPLPLLLHVEVNEKNKWWLDKTLVTIEQRYVLHYFPLFDSIRLNNLTDGSSLTFDSIDDAFNKLGVINRFPILDKEHFADSEEVYARIRLKIDAASLPKPLRTESLLGGSWDISSDWMEWTLR